MGDVKASTVSCRYMLLNWSISLWSLVVFDMNSVLYNQWPDSTLSLCRLKTASVSFKPGCGFILSLCCFNRTFPQNRLNWGNLSDITIKRHLIILHQLFVSQCPHRAGNLYSGRNLKHQFSFQTIYIIHIVSEVLCRGLVLHHITDIFLSVMLMLIIPVSLKQELGHHVSTHWNTPQHFTDSAVSHSHTHDFTCHQTTFTFSSILFSAAFILRHWSWGGGLILNSWSQKHLHILTPTNDSNLD